MLIRDCNKLMHDVNISFRPRISCRLNILLIWMFFCLLIIHIIPVQALDADQPGLENCDIQHNSCIQKLSGTVVILDINPKPVKTMKDLKFRIILRGQQPMEAPYIDLGMPDMKMGPNRVLLRSLGKGVYEGKGTIVRCLSGKKIWKATVTVPSLGVVEFIFDVVY